MKAYQFNTDTGEYIGEIELQASPEEPGVYFQRPDATTDPMPELKEHEAAVRAGERWTVKADYRGNWWNKKTKVMYIIDDLDIFPGTDWTDQNPAADGISPNAVWSDKESAWVWDADAEEKAEQERINWEARGYLAETDWYVIRAHETGKEIPAEILVAREKARARVADV